MPSSSVYHHEDGSSAGEQSLEMELEDDDECDDWERNLELTGLASNGTVPAHNPSSQRPPSASPLQLLCQFVKLSWDLYPRRVVGIGIIFVVLLLYAWWPDWRGRIDLTRHSLDRHYANVRVDEQTYDELTHAYDQLAASVDHWCLFGDNNQCQCEPLVATGQERDAAVYPGWKIAHDRNKDRIQNRTNTATTAVLDVVFVGDETFQVWGDGRFFDRNYGSEGPRIAAMFRETLGGHSRDRHRGRALGKSSTSSDAIKVTTTTTNRGLRAIQGLALGIYADQTSHLLWRLQHGEMPPELQSKIWWILIGSNDLALAMCSEDAVVLGILRIAEEIHFHHPHATIVIQGLLPRSNHADGSLEPNPFKDDEHHPQQPQQLHPFDQHNVWHERTNQVKEKTDAQGHPIFDVVTQTRASSAIAQARAQRTNPYFDYYVWPSIRAINTELRGFCEHHQSQKFIYYDVDDLLVQNQTTTVIATKYYREVEQRIISKYMPNSVFLSEQGHKVVMQAVKEQVAQLLDRINGDSNGT